MSHSNIAIFVPHLGCKCRCSFCDQNSITNENTAPNADDIHNAVLIAKKSKKYNSETTEIAFFGGSFTAIERDYMVSLLQAAYIHIKNGDVSGIRISTRPDCIDDEILLLLKSLGVTAIELGAQSMDDDVLLLNRRGHTSQDVVASSKLIKLYGFELGLQMMTGLYGDTFGKSMKTAEKIIELAPKTVRIYPTVVFENTLLASLYKQDKYTPQTVENAVKLGALLIPMFKKSGISVIRFGLHSADTEKIIGGAWHPALAQLVHSEIFKNDIQEELLKMPKGDYIIECNPKDISSIIGHKRCNIDFFSELGYNCRVIQNSEKIKNQFKITERKVYR